MRRTESFDVSGLFRSPESRMAAGITILRSVERFRDSSVDLHPLSKSVASVTLKPLVNLMVRARRCDRCWKATF